MVRQVSQPGARDEICQSLYLERLVQELRQVSDMSLALQSCIHDLDLAATDTISRRALQSADTLTQSLQCIASAVSGLADAERGEGRKLPVDILDGVFLEDVRQRLLNGRPEFGGGSRLEAGEVELF